MRAHPGQERHSPSFVEPARPAPHSPGLVGRAAELVALTGAMSGIACGGPGRVVLVEGPAGVGKTALLEESVREAPALGLRIVCARGEDPAGRSRFRLLNDLLRCLPAPADQADHGRLRGRCAHVDEGLELLVRACRRTPTVLVVDDLQWADATSVAALCRLVRRIAQLPLLVVGAARTVPRLPELSRLLDAAHESLSRIAVRPLLPDAVEALVERLAGGDDPSALAALVPGAAGVPGLLVELFSSERPSAAGAEYAVTASYLMRRRILAPETTEVLTMASVIGTEFALHDLALLLGRAPLDVWPTVREALHADVLGEDHGRLAFRQTLVREALYASLPLTVRRALHLQLARALAAAGRPAVLVAPHLVRGAERGDAEALRWFADEAERAAAGSPSTAIVLLHSALDLADPSHPARGGLLRDLASNLIRVGDADGAVDLCSEALCEDGLTGIDGRTEAHLHLLLVQASVLGGRAREALGDAAVQPWHAPADLHARVEGWCALARVLCSDAKGAEDQARAALTAAVAAGDAPGACQALVVLARVASARGRFADAVATARHAVLVAEGEPGLDVALSMPHLHLGLVLLQMGELDEAIRAVERGRLVAARAGLRALVRVHEAALACAYFESGRWADAGRRSGECCEAPPGVAPALAAVRLRLAIESGAVGAAEAQLPAATARQRLGAVPGLDCLPLVEALLLEVRGRSGEALRRLKAAWVACCERDEAGQAFVLGEDVVRLALEAGDRATAERAVTLAERVSEANGGAPGLSAVALRCRGLLNDDPVMLLAAADAFARTGRPVRRAAACEDAGCSLLRRGRADQARAQFEEALEVYEAAGAGRGVARVRSHLRRLGVNPGVRGPRRREKEGWGALTETELKVVELVAQGLSNPQIAERLFISRRTVQTHVSHVLLKLGVKSRQEVAGEVRRRGTPAVSA